MSASGSRRQSLAHAWPVTARPEGRPTESAGQRHRHHRHAHLRRLRRRDRNRRHDTTQDARHPRLAVDAGQLHCLGAGHPHGDRADPDTIYIFRVVPSTSTASRPLQLHQTIDPVLGGWLAARCSRIGPVLTRRWNSFCQPLPTSRR